MTNEQLQEYFETSAPTCGQCELSNDYDLQIDRDKGAVMATCGGCGWITTFRLPAPSVPRIQPAHHLFSRRLL
jgi:transcription elongation factor Elf1